MENGSLADFFSQTFNDVFLLGSEGTLDLGAFNYSMWMIQSEIRLGFHHV